MRQRKLLARYLDVITVEDTTCMTATDGCGSRASRSNTLAEMVVQ